MGLDVKSLASMGFAVARKLVPDVFLPAIIRLGPKAEIDVETDESVTRWQVEIRTHVFGYEDNDERKDTPASVRVKSFILNPAEYPPGSPFLQTGQVECDGDVWEIYKAELLPANAGVIFHGRA